MLMLWIFTAQAAQDCAWIRHYPDNDGDGIGAGEAEVACLPDAQPPEGRALRRDDCDDSNAAIHPDADEVCDGVDNNCDGAVDVGAVDEAGVEDLDGDGLGSAIPPRWDACPGDPNTATTSTDCDDSTPDLTDDCTTAWLGTTTARFVYRINSSSYGFGGYMVVSEEGAGPPITISGDYSGDPELKMVGDFTSGTTAGGTMWLTDSGSTWSSTWSATLSGWQLRADVADPDGGWTLEVVVE